MKIYPTYLPNEILSIIINKFAGPSDTEDNDLETLAACRLASYTLCSLATPLLFSSIQLAENRTTRNGIRSPVEEGAVKLNQLLTNKDIAASVRTLTLKLCSINFENSTSSMITEILHRLPHIQDFTLEALQEYCWEGYQLCCESEQIPFYWIAEDSLALAIQDLVTSPKLTKLKLSNIYDIPLAIITACPNLQHLCLSNIDFSHKDDTDVISSLQGSYLYSLEIDEDSLASLDVCIGEGVSFAEYFSRLKNLRINNKEMFIDDWDIVLLASQTITTLAIFKDRDLSAEISLEDAPYDLGHFPSLKHFTIQLPISFEDNRIMLRFLNQLLSISSSTSRIESLEIEIIWCLGWDGRGKDVLSLDTGWSALDETLTSDKFPSLSHVVFALKMFQKEGFDPSDDHCRRLELVQDLTPCVGTLLPMLRTWSKNTQRTLKIDLEFLKKPVELGTSEHT